MRRMIVIFVLILFLSVGFAFGQAIGTVREISGTVEIKPPGAADFNAASVGDSLTEDTVISTAFRSTAIVEFGSTTISVRPLTRLTMLEISSSEGVESLNVGLQAGRVRVDVNPPAGTRASMSVSSPSATASVRGTEFWFDGRNLSVGEGSVDFRGRRGTNVAVNAGFASTVTREGRASTARYTGAGRASAAAAASDDGESVTDVDTEDSIVILTGADGEVGLLPGNLFLEQGSGTIEVGPSPDPVPDAPPPITPGPETRPPNGGNGGNGGGGVDIGIQY